MEDNTSDAHTAALKFLCRVCGRKIKPSKKSRSVYVCADHQTDLMNTFGVDVQRDSPVVHPLHFCQSCKGAIYNCKKRGLTFLNAVTWHPHSDNCETCKQAESVRTGGRPAKETGRPAACSRKSLISHVKEVCLHSYHPPSSVHSPLSVSTPSQYGVRLQDLTCSICLDVVDQPVDLTDCASLVCAPCLTSWLFECDHSFLCPCCHRHLADTDSIRSVSSVVEQLIEGLLVSCSCGKTVMNREYPMHTCTTGCQVGGVSEVSQGSVATLSDILSKPHNSPLTPLEWQVQTNLAKRSLATSPEENTIHMKTRGQVSIV